MKAAYEKFKKDCPSLDFKKSDEVIAKFILRGFDLKMFRKQINKLKKDSEDITEMFYLINFFEEIYQRCKRNNAEENMNIDLNKLKYCKTLLVYYGTEYAEGLVNGIDYIQDQIARSQFSEKRVFYYSHEK